MPRPRRLLPGGRNAEGSKGFPALIVLVSFPSVVLRFCVSAVAATWRRALVKAKLRTKKASAPKKLHQATPLQPAHADRTNSCVPLISNLVLRNSITDRKRIGKNRFMQLMVRTHQKSRRCFRHRNLFTVGVQYFRVANSICHMYKCLQSETQH